MPVHYFSVTSAKLSSDITPAYVHLDDLNKLFPLGWIRLLSKNDFAGAMEASRDQKTVKAAIGFKKTADSKSSDPIFIGLCCYHVDDKTMQSYLQHKRSRSPTGFSDTYELTQRSPPSEDFSQIPDLILPEHAIHSNAQPDLSFTSDDELVSVE